MGSFGHSRPRMRAGTQRLRLLAQHPTLVLSSLLLLLLALDMYNVGMIMPHYTYHHYRQEWVRQYSKWDWGWLARERAALPRYQLPTNLTIPVKVLSLARSRERRAHAAAELLAAGVTDFSFVDALDGDAPLPEAEIEAYFKGERLAKYRRRTGNARYKVACDLSHFRLLHALLGGDEPMALVLEDDFTVAASARPLRAALAERLAALPADWDVLRLQLCDATLEGEVGRGARLFSRGFCTLGLVYTRRAALIVLHAARAGNRNIDNLLLDLALVGRLRSYVADPPLVLPLDPGAWPSEIDKGTGPKDPF